MQGFAEGCPGLENITPDCAATQLQLLDVIQGLARQG